MPPGVRSGTLSPAGAPPSRRDGVVPIRVLIADDDDRVRLGLATLLGEEEGIAVVALAATAGEAVSLAAEHRPHVAFLDVRMPGGGAAAARGIAEVSPTTRVVACSAFDDPAAQREMRDAGAVRYLAKGSGLSDLPAIVREVVSGG